MHGMRVLVEVAGPMKMHDFVGGIIFGGARALGKNRNVGAVSKRNEVYRILMQRKFSIRKVMFRS